MIHRGLDIDQELPRVVMRKGIYQWISEPSTQIRPVDFVAYPKTLDERVYGLVYVS